jgi:molybdenum cofactor cytidylyltransferase
MSQPGTQPLVLGVVVLAAGRSSRMGRPKLLLPWGTTSVLGHLVARWQALGAKQLAIVCAAADAAMTVELERIGFPARHRINNPAPDRGMFSSIQCAVNWPGWQPDLTHWAIVLGDQPHLRPNTLQAVLNLALAQPLKACQPSWHHQPRHPVLLPKSLFAQCGTAPERDLKAFLATCPRAVCEVDDDGLDLDLDTPEDYERARQLSALA